MRETLAPPRERGHLEIRPRVVDRVGRRAATEVDGVVRGTSGRLGRQDLPSVSSRVDGSRVQLDIDVAVAWGRPAAVVAAAVRDQVAARVQQLTGLVVDAVDVTVDSVVLADEPRTGRVM